MVILTKKLTMNVISTLITKSIVIVLWNIYIYIIKKHLKNILYNMYNALVAQSEERVTVNHEVDRSKLSEGVI